VRKGRQASSMKPGGRRAGAEERQSMGSSNSCRTAAMRINNHRRAAVELIVHPPTDNVVKLPKRSRK
jgi:hypothetical protein